MYVAVLESYLIHFPKTRRNKVGSYLYRMTYCSSSCNCYLLIQEYVVTSENNMSRSLMYFTKMFLDDNMKEDMDLKHLKTWIVVRFSIMVS